MSTSGTRQLPVATRPPRERPPEERSLLPGMALNVADTSDDEPAADPLLAMSQGPIMRCNTCYVATNCPKFEAGSACAFDIPVQVRSRDQLSATMATLTEMQMQRIMFARYVEQLQGGYPDPNLSQELDRYFSMLSKMKEVEDNRESLRMTIDARGKTGVISRIFGEKLGVQARGLPEPVEANELMANVIDANAVKK